MKNKKKLRGKEGYNNQVYINEDLTRLRARLFYLVRKSGKVTSTSTKNGRIYCNVPGKQRPIILDSPDDLHRLEFDEVPYSRSRSRLLYPTRKCMSIINSSITCKDYCIY